MRILITEKTYRTIVTSEKGNRPIENSFDFPNGSIIIYDSEYEEGYFHVEAWTDKYNTNLKRLKSQKNIIKRNLNAYFTDECPFPIYNSGYLNQGEDCFFLGDSDYSLLLFKSHRKDVLKKELSVSLKIIKDDMKFKKRNRIALI